MEGDQEKEGTVDLLEDCWFFSNLLDTRSKISRCNSDPAPCSKEDEMFEFKKSISTSKNLIRAPSLPHHFGGGGDEDWDGDDEEDEPRMSYLIRQAMPCRIKKDSLSKLTRRSSMDPSLLLPPKHTYKGIKHNFSAPSTSKNLQKRRPETTNRGLKARSLERSMSLKTLSDVEVQGFQDLGFTFDKEDLSPSVVSKLASLRIKEEGDEETGECKRNPSLSEAWNATQWSYSPPIPKVIDTKISAEDMKAQIKFWARAVASNVRQEC